MGINGGPGVSGLLSEQPRGLIAKVPAINSKLRTLISGSQTDYGAPITISILPRMEGNYATYVTKPKTAPVLQHHEIPVYSKSADDDRDIDIDVLRYEAARNSGSYASEYQSLIRRYEATRFYGLRQMKKAAKVTSVENRDADSETANRGKTFDEFISEEYDVAIETDNRFKMLAKWVDQEVSSPSVNAVSFNNLRDVCWRRSKKRQKKFKKKDKPPPGPENLAPKTIQVIQPRLELKLTRDGQSQQEAGVIQRNGLVIYTPSNTGKTKYLSKSMMSILQVSSAVTRKMEYLQPLLDCGFIIATSDERVLDYDIPLIALYPAPIRAEAKDGRMVISQAENFDSVLNECLFANVIC